MAPQQRAALVHEGEARPIVERGRECPWCHERLPKNERHAGHEAWAADPDFDYVPRPRVDSDPCDDCGGAGVTDEERQRALEAETPGARKYRPCRTCNGRGRLNERQVGVDVFKVRREA